jgi:hypothetical protein
MTRINEFERLRPLMFAISYRIPKDPIIRQERIL